MPALRDIEQTIKLEDGKSFVGVYDPAKDVGENETQFGTQYTFRFLATDGRVVKLKGYARLFDAMMEAVGVSDKPLKLEVTAQGKAGTTDRTFRVRKI